MKPNLALLVKNDMSRLSEYVWLLVVFVVLGMACPLVALVDGTPWPNKWFYVNKCETASSHPGLAASILNRKLSILR